ncbi:hypothetical protein NLX83_29260 [Allokutzneria sp. A3M-2-11 16]|nr:hypothetical protein [Allokutzneria sp. A3M-2-11 16]
MTERLDEALSAYRPDVFDVRKRDGFHRFGPRPGLLEWMPAARLGGTVALKMVGYHPHNPAEHGLPTILSSLYGFDSDSGRLRIIADGTFATAVRTGVASMIASRALADPDSEVLGLVGAGAQAVTQLHALARRFPLRRVLVSDPDPAAVASFAARSRFPAGMIEAVPLAVLEREANIICTCTSVLPGAGPVISGAELRHDVHINAVGSDMPGKVELPLALLRRATVCPDLLAQAMLEGECQQLAADEVGPSLFDLVQDPAAGAAVRGGPTVFDSTGLALEDLVMVEVLEELAERHSLGRFLDIEASSGDPRDPYAFLAESDAAGLFAGITA